MSAYEGWSDSVTEIIERLERARAQRLATGRKENRELRVRIAEARSRGDERHADHLSLQLHKKSIAFTRRQRLRELAQREADLKRVGAAVRRHERELESKTPHSPARVFEFEPSRSGTRLRDARDLFWEWIPRGFSKGKNKNFKGNGSPRIRAREAKWSEREFELKIAYIERADALEPVAGNLFSNMGADQAERLGCASRIDEIERLSRSNAGVYVHSILALPADLSPDGRAAVLREIGVYYNALSVPFTAALHKPDPKNSQKNFHAHILVSLRPMERVGDRWEFATTKLTWLGSPAGLKLQRKVIASIFNRALAAEQQQNRYTAKSRARDGLAPGGFTKREGVRRTGTPTLKVEDALVARDTLDDAQALDAAIAALEEVAIGLEGSEARFRQMHGQVQASRRMTPDETILAVPRGRHQVPDAQELSLEGSVANSQPARENTGEGDDQARSREIGTELSDALDGPDNPASGLPPLGGDGTPPLRHDWLDYERFERERAYRKSEKMLRASASYRALTKKDRDQLDVALEQIETALVTNAASASITGNCLVVSASEPEVMTLISEVADSQPGWEMMQALAVSGTFQGVDRFPLARTLVEPSDWPPVFDPRDRGRGGR